MEIWFIEIVVADSVVNFDDSQEKEDSVKKTIKAKKTIRMGSVLIFKKLIYLRK